MVQVQRLAAEVSRHRSQDATAVRFLALTGLRWGELAALKVGSFDMLRRRVQITEAMAEVKGKTVVSTPKTHEQRTVPFPSSLADELAALMVGKSREELVFTSPDGNWYRVSTFRSRVFAPAVLRSQKTDPDFPTLTPDDLRALRSLARHLGGGQRQERLDRARARRGGGHDADTYADLFPARSGRSCRAS